ncbi:MAG: hypothetical protein JWL84_5969 [Rhodospirillales bacterium]|jgi:small-conductance mechanosensitive channel/CRP-like cAMP-binding protein|nr:hypothetical protein [Rhodospirillales bacterium]
MMARLRSRLLLPGILILIFALGLVFMPEVMSALGEAAAERIHVFYADTAQIGLWLCGAFLTIRLIDVLVWDPLDGRALGRAIPQLLKEALGLAIYIVAAAGIVGMVFDQSITGIWATSGAVGLIIGLALRSIILDIFTGLAVNFDQSYRIGDWIELLDRGPGAVFGRVAEINWRTTRVEAEDKRIFVIPNSRMGEMSLVNFSLPDEICRFEAVFTLDFGVPVERARRVLLGAVKAACGDGPLEQPEPAVLVGNVTALGVEYRVRWWQRVGVLSPSSGRDIVTRSILTHLERTGLTLAYPKQDLFHAGMPNRQLDHRSGADRAALLAKVTILGTLTDEERHLLARAMAPRVIAAGTELIRQGAQGASMFILAEGLLEVWLSDAGRSVKLATIQPGEFAGEMSLLTGEARSASILAGSEALLYELTAESLLPVLAARPELFEAISELVALRRLGNTKVLAEAASPQAAEQVRGVTAQILGKMRIFFAKLSARPADVAVQFGD